MQLIKKISAKSVIGNVKSIALATFYIDKDTDKPDPEAPSELALYTIMGVCNGVKTGTGDNGDWLSFEGDFKAIRASDGEEFRGPRAFIAEPASAMLETALGENDVVEMAFNVSIVAGDNAYGYEFRMSPILEVAESDAISALEQKVQALLAAPKPKAEPKAEPKTAPKKTTKKKKIVLYSQP